LQLVLSSRWKNDLICKISFFFFKLCPKVAMQNATI